MSSPPGPMSQSNVAAKAGRAALVTTIASGWKIVVLAAAVAMLAASPAVAATTFTVSSTSDGIGSCSGTNCTTLRAAVSAANGAMGAVIELGVGTYTLNNGVCGGASDLGELDVEAPMTIEGKGPGGAGGTTIKQTDGCDRVLEIAPSSGGGVVTVSDLEVTGGDAFANDSTDGGGILIDPPASAVSVGLQDALVTNNRADGGQGGQGGGEGGGIAVTTTATLILSASTAVSDNTATAAAGVPNASGDTAIGGGIFCGGTGTVTIDDSTITDNTAAGGAGGAAAMGFAGNGGEGQGGGLAAEGCAVSVSASSITGNHATGATGGEGSLAEASGQGGFALGGGIFTEDTPSPPALAGDTVSGNDATGGAAGSPFPGGAAGIGGQGFGGGLAAQLGGGTAPVTVDSTTLAGNSATGGSPDGGAVGGALASDTGVEVVNSTVLGNAATGPGADQGGGVFAAGEDLDDIFASDTIDANSVPVSGAGGNLYTDGAPVSATDTIVAGGVGPAASNNCAAFGATIGDLTPGHNLEDDPGPTPQCNFSAITGDIVGQSPELASALAGSPPQTLALQAGSPALGAGGACVNPLQAGEPLLDVDERGEPRGSTCDIGAFQSQPPANTMPPAVSGTLQPGQTLTCAPGTWSGDGPFNYTFAWLRGGSTISGATGSTFVTSAADVGQQLACRVTATGPAGGATATSATVTVAAATTTTTTTTTTTPTTATSTTSTPSTPGPGTAAALRPLSASLAKASSAGAELTMTVGCTGGAATSVCSGSITVKGKVIVRGGKAVAPAIDALAKKPKPPQGRSTSLTVASGFYSVATGKRATVTLTLNAAAQRLLSQFYELPATVAINGSTQLTRAVTFRYAVINSFISFTWEFNDSYTTDEDLAVSGLPSKPRVLLTCRGGGCPFGKRVLKPRSRTISLASNFADAHLAPGTTVEIAITAADDVGKVGIMLMRRGQQPLFTVLCLPPGASHPLACVKPHG